MWFSDNIFIFLQLGEKRGGLLDMDGEEQLNVGDSDSEAEKSKASNCLSGSLDEGNKLEDETKPCQDENLEDSVEPATESGAASLQVGFEVTGTVVIPEEVKGVHDAENGCISVSPKDDGSLNRSPVVDGRCILVCVKFSIQRLSFPLYVLFTGFSSL